MSSETEKELEGENMYFNFKQRYDGVEIAQMYVDMGTLKSKNVKYQLTDDNILIPLKANAEISDDEYENDFCEKFEIIRTSLKSQKENYITEKINELY